MLSGMIFPDYRQILLYGILIGCLILSVLAYRAVGKVKGFVRIAVRTLSLIVVVLSSLLILIAVGCNGPNSRSSPIYSPDRRHAIRINDYDYGATGGETMIDLYSNYGLRSASIFDGDWKTTQPKNVQWLSDRELLIHYEPSYEPPRCKSAGEVAVRCEPVPNGGH